MASGWNLSMRLDALEVVEWLAAVFAAVERLAGRRAKFALARGPRRSAARAGGRGIAPEQTSSAPDRMRRRRDAEFAELAATLLAQPVTRPGWREHVDGDCVESGGAQRPQDVRFDDGVRRTARIRRRDADFEAPVGAELELPDHAEVEHREDRDFRVGDLCEYPVQPRQELRRWRRRVGRVHAHGRLPGRAGMRAAQGLHLGEKVTQVFGMCTGFSALLHPGIFRNR